MDKYKILYLISDENRWNHLFGEINHIIIHPELIDRIAVIVIDTAILSCLSNTIFEDFKNQLRMYKEKGIDFFLCNNTCLKYGITEEFILPQFELVMEGGILKALSLEKEGYRLFSLGM